MPLKAALFAQSRERVKLHGTDKYVQHRSELGAFELKQPL